MLRSKVLSPAALLAALVVVAAAPAASVQPAQKADFRSCPDLAAVYTNNIHARGVTCAEAKRVIGRYTRAIIENLQHDWSVAVLGFHCDLSKKDFYGDSHRCAADGGKVVRFRRGTH